MSMTDSSAGNGTVWVDVRGDTSQFMKDVAAGAKKATSGLAGIAKSGVQTVMGDIARTSGVAGIALGGLGAVAVKTSMDFNAAMSGVGAVANASVAEMESLRRAALKAGADTVFSASQAADAQAELVKAGVSVSDVLGGALTGSLSLAAAGQLDLANAATISAQAMNIFNLGGQDVGHIADVLAAGANKSAADVGQLGQALEQGGLKAKETGLGLEDTVGVLSLFADNALIGSDAGTSLKTMLQRLVPQSGEAAAAMEALGLNFYDAQGSFVGIEEVARQLKTSLSGLSDEQRSAALDTIFGADANRAAAILMEAGAEGVRDYTTAVNDMGAAQRMAAKQVDNLKGDIEAFKGATETALINLGDLADSSLRGVTQSATGFVNVFNDFANTPAWASIARNVDELTSGLGGGLDGLSDDLRGLLDGIDPAEVDRVFATVSGTFSRLREAVQGMEGVLGGVGLSIAGLGAQSVLGPLGGIVPAISPITGILGGLVLGSDEGRDALKGLGKEAQQFATGTGADLLESLSDLSQNVAEGLASALEDVGTALFDAADVLGPVFGEALDDLGPPISELIESLGELTASVLPAVADLAGTVLPPVFDVLGTGIGVTADAVSLLADNMWVAVPALAAFAAIKYGDALSGMANFVRDAGGVGKALEGIAVGGALKADQTFGNLRNTLTSGFTPALAGATAAVTGGVFAYEAWSRNVQRVDDETKALTESLLEQAKDVLPTLASQFRNILETRGGFDDAFARSGLTIEGVTQIVNDNVGAMDRMREVWNDTPGSSHLPGLAPTAADLDEFRSRLDEVPASVRPVIENLLDMNDAGKLSASEFEAVIDAMTDLDIEASGTAESIAFNAEQMAKGIPAAERTAEVLKDIATAGDTTAGLDVQRDALARLAAQFPEVAAAAGIAVGDVASSNANLANETARAVGELRNLADEFAALSGAAQNVDEANRRYLDAQRAVAEALAKNGAGIDANTDAGARNADAIQRMVEASKALAEAQAQTDVTGKTSTETLNGVVGVLTQMRDAGQLTAEEYQHLLDIYGLTPEAIATTVVADTSDAESNLTDLKARFDTMKGEMSQPIATYVQALIDAGRYDLVEQALNNVARERQVKITPIFQITDFKMFGGTGMPTAKPQGKASGGLIFGGNPIRIPGYGTDTELIMATPGEHVMPAPKVRQPGMLPLLEGLRSGAIDPKSVQGYEMGGIVGAQNQDLGYGLAKLSAMIDSGETLYVPYRQFREVLDRAPAQGWRVQEFEDESAHVWMSDGREFGIVATGSWNAAARQPKYADQQRRWANWTPPTSAGGTDDAYFGYQRPLRVPDGDAGTEMFRRLRAMGMDTDYTRGVWRLDGLEIGRARDEWAGFDVTTTNQLARAALKSAGAVFADSLPSFHTGGVLPGALGQEAIYRGLGGETVRTPEAEAQLVDSMNTAGIEERLDRLTGRFDVLSASMSALATRPIPAPVVQVTASAGVHVTAQTRARSFRSGD